MNLLNIATEILRFIKSTFFGLIGWILIVPVALIIPKCKKTIAVIGRYDGEFSDNTKYFFLQSIEKLHEYRIFFLTQRKDVKENLSECGLPVYRYPSPFSIFLLLRTSLVVVDNNQWGSGFRRFILIKSNVVQLWHGVGFKRIQLNKIENEAPGRYFLNKKIIKKIRRISRFISGKLVFHDLVVSTSKFYCENVFKPSFLSKYFLITGYPRNTFGKGLLENSALWIGVDNEIRAKMEKWQEEGRKVVIFLPSFRDSGRNPINLGEDNLKRLDAVCAQNRIEFVLKFHPYDKNSNNFHGKHIHVMKSSSDIYPLLPLTSTLITDYSSIYTDYTLLNKPIIFFAPDLESYINKERQIQFDYNEITPGPKIKNWSELIDELKNETNASFWEAKRVETKKIAFDNINQNESTSSILRFAKKNGWIR